VFEAVVLWGEASKATVAVADFLLNAFRSDGACSFNIFVRQSGPVPAETVCDVLMNMMDQKIPKYEPGFKRAFPAEMKPTRVQGLQKTTKWVSAANG
jgi:hypothetical protein